MLLTVGRWPTLAFPFALNPDESQLLAGAHTLRWDPLFWRSVNGMTSGPLNFYALWPIGTLLGRDSYLSGRLTALALIIGSLGSAHLTVARRFGAAAARLGGLPTVIFLAFTAHPDFTHYSSELPSMALIAIAVALSVDWVWDRRTGRGREIGIGLLLGAVPFAKPQAAPVALAIGVALLVWQAWSPLPSLAAMGRLCFGAVLPLAVAGLLVASHGLGQFVVTAYFLANGDYVHTAVLTVGATARMVLTQIEPMSLIFYAWIAASAATGLLALWWVKPINRADRDFLIAAFGLAVVAFACVITPRRTFPHYLMLMPVPWTLFCGGLIGADFRRERLGRTASTWRGFVPAMGVLLVGVRVSAPYLPAPEATFYHSDFSGQVTALIRRYTQPGDALAVWGWRPDYYVLTGLRQATRDAITESSILPSPYQDFFRAYYLADLERVRPAVFVDGVGPGGFGYDQRSFGAHELNFPALGTVIKREYTLEGDIDGARIYVRNDRARHHLVGT